VIRYATGDIFESKAEVLVNPVNCEGVMGKGLALEFKKRFSGLFPWYQEDCKGLRPATRIGSSLLYSMPDWSHKVICFPTKGRWREPSQYSYVEHGLRDLRRKLLADWSKIASLAMPKLGCGLGGLEWERVCPLIETELKEVPQSIEVYA
jgi:O-acetyl-ADP-ribose deacetylase (regulator of RNase III)